MRYITGSVEVIGRVLSVIAGEGSDASKDDIMKTFPDLKWYIW